MDNFTIKLKVYIYCSLDKRLGENPGFKNMQNKSAKYSTDQKLLQLKT